MLRKAIFKPLCDLVRESGAELPSPELRTLRSVQVISFVHDRRGPFLRWFSVSFVTLVLAFALLVVVGWMPGLGYPTTPSLSPGASLQAVGFKAPVWALTVPAVSGSQRAPDPRDRAARGAQPGWTAAPPAPERSAILRPTAAPGQPSQRGRYGLSTVLSGLKPILAVVPSTTWAMAAIALLAFLAGRPVAQQPMGRQAVGSTEPAPARKAVPAARWLRQRIDWASRPLHTVWRAFRAPQRVAFPRLQLLTDLLADWERQRLVPT